MRRRRPVPLDPHRDRDQRAGNHVGELGAGAPIDGAGRQMEQQVDEPRALATEQPGVKLLLPRADARRPPDHPAFDLFVSPAGSTL